MKFFFFILPQFIFSISPCTRSVQVQSQEIQIDFGHKLKGEGLRPYLSKDPIAEQYLNSYQKTPLWTKIGKFSGPLAGGLILSGLLTTNQQTKDSFVVIGGTIMLLTFLMAKTSEITQEKKLLKSIEEYNRRHIPKIELSFYLQKEWSF